MYLLTYPYLKIKERKMDHSGNLTKDEVAFVQKHVNNWRTPRKRNVFERHPYITSITILALLFQGALWIASHYLTHFKEYAVILLSLIGIFLFCVGLYLATEGDDISLPISTLGLQAALNMQYWYFGHLPKSIVQWSVIACEFMIFYVFCLYVRGLIRLNQAAHRSRSEPIYRK